MAGEVRTTITGVGGKYISREEGVRVGLQINTFGMSKLIEAINGEALRNILVEAMDLAYRQAVAEWPVDTGASRDSIDVEVTDVGLRSARVALFAGGDKLRHDSRNPSGRDYAPYIEFNGTASAPPGILIHAMIANESDMKNIIKERIADLIRRLG